jgi:phosphoribosylformylglycinamidine synthase
VDLLVEPEAACIFTRGLTRLRAPVAHGEGRFTTQEGMYRDLERNGQVVLRYGTTAGERAEGVFPANPNGSLGDVAGICDRTGKIFGLMPHPERAFLFIQQDDWARKADGLRRGGRLLPEYTDCYTIFTNAVEYFG